MVVKRWWAWWLRGGGRLFRRSIVVQPKEFPKTGRVVVADCLSVAKRLEHWGALQDPAQRGMTEGRAERGG